MQEAQLEVQDKKLEALLNARDKDQQQELQEVGDEIAREIRHNEKEAGTKLEAVDYGMNHALKELAQLSDPQKQAKDDYYTQQLLNEYNDKVLGTRCTQLKKSVAQIATHISESTSLIIQQLRNQLSEQTLNQTSSSVAIQDPAAFSELEKLKE